MSYQAEILEPRRGGFGPADDPALFSGLRSKRIMAFLIDTAIIAFFTVLAAILVFFLGIFTLGLAWFAYAFCGRAWH
ncbi:hypothetical protein V6L77_20430 [Pannonibacter sp. Pt2-lr]